MNKQQLDAQLIQWLKVLESQTQKEFGDKMSTRQALEGIGEYKGDIKIEIDNQMDIIKYKFNWLYSQISEIRDNMEFIENYK